MQIRNNIYLLVSLVALACILLILLVIQNSADSSEVDKNLFKVADQTKINRVLLEMGEEKIKLEYNGIKWILNDSLDADRQLIKVFFATLLQVQPKRPVAERQEDSVKNRMAKNGTKVALYEDEDLMKAFSVSGNDNKTETYFQLKQDNQPYVVTIPGYRVYVAGIFEMDAQEWRDKRIFNFNWQNFKRLTTSYPSSPSGDFAISFQNGFFGLEGNLQADTTQLNDYLDAVSLIQAARFIRKDEAPLFDSLFNQPPAFTIRVNDIANRSYSLDVFNVPVNNAYMPARLNGRDGVLLDIQEMQRINRKKSDFIK